MINVLHEIIDHLSIHENLKAELHDKLNAATAEDNPPEKGEQDA